MTKMKSMKSIFNTMINKNANVDDRSRNGRNPEKSPVRAIVTLIKAVEETAGERNHANGYSLDVMANFFREHHNFDDYVTCYNDTERQQVNELFERIAESLDFNVYLQRKVLENLQGKFTAEQLSCIFQAYNGIWIQYSGKSDVFAKQELFDYIDNEGMELYDLGDVEAFKGLINSINPIEYDVFVNVIQEFWGMDSTMVKRLVNYLKSDTLTVAHSKVSNISENIKKQISWVTFITQKDAFSQE